MTQDRGDGMGEFEHISIKLSGDEALVLFDWLARFNKNNNTDLTDQAEQRVLWDIESSLESALVQVFSEDYTSLLDEARSRLQYPAP
ncbi:hypothetical protein J3A64_004747 [Pseudarthrobacter sp. PvP004]|uniref:hypothetical protein n=1 Tax=Pseudarthrobacter sp. PvP004 TaxID=2817850 RepID=UPI001AE4B924|nr:hypothetical protein [Pseudarthrobacter sp. PvP004]MBP2269207.1 hypothetical protein [Pseudarthrobacter sp. PvP004]